MADSSGIAQSHGMLLLGLIILAVVATCLTGILLWILYRAQLAAQKRPGKNDKASNSGANDFPQDGKSFISATDFDATFRRNLDRLRQLAVGRSYRYDVPWALVVGPTSSGKTTALEAVGLRRTMSTDTFAAVDSKLGIGWHLFNEGLAIDVPGSIFVGNGEKDQRDRWWGRLLRQLRAARPQRPLDAVVLVISVEDLRSQSSGGLSSLALIIRDRLAELQKQIEMRMPVYLLITKCDLLSGFEALSRELSESVHGQMMGWSNPHSIDLAFSSAWLEEAVFSIGDRIDRLTFEILGAEEKTESAEEMFLFRNDLGSIQSGLREFASRIFSETAYGQSPLLRGVYLTGDPNGQPLSGKGPAALESRARPAFLDDLLARKVYAEKGVATPFPNAFLSKNRMTLALQIATAAFVMATVIGTSLAYARLNRAKQDQLTPLLAVLHYQVGTSSNVSGDAALRVIRAITDLEVDPFRSVFFPQSWSDSIDRLLGDAMVRSFLSVFEGLRVALRERHTQILEQATGGPSQCSNPGSQEQYFEHLPQYEQLNSFVSALDRWNSNVTLFNRIVTPGLGNPEELRQLALYLNPDLLPEDVDFGKNQYFQRALNRANDRTFHNFDAAGTTKAIEQLSSCFFNAWFGGNVILTYKQSLEKQIGDLEAGSMTFSELGKFAQLVGDASSLLERPEFQWAAKDRFSPTDYPVFQDSVLRSNAVESSALAAYITTYGEEAFQTFRTGLAQASTSSVGPVVEQGAGTLMISDELIALEAFVGKMEQQPFATRVPSGEVPGKPLGRAIIWNPEALASANQLYRDFATYSFAGLPAAFRTPVQMIASARTQDNMLDLIASAQSFQSQTGSSANDAGMEMAKNLTTVAGPLSDLLQDFNHTGLLSGRNVLTSVVTDQVTDFLRLLDGKEANLNPYEVKGSTFAWWNGETPLAPLAYQVPTEEDVKATLSSQTSALRELAQAAQPALDLLRVSNSLAARPVHASRVDWAGVLRDFQNLDGKKANPISSLETFLSSGMDKITPQDSCIAAPIAMPGDSSDLFVSIEKAISTQLISRCRELAEDGYAQIATDFNAHLMGRFPFSDPASPPGGAEADPADIVNFFKIFDRFQAGAMEVLKRGSVSDTLQAKELGFLQQIAAARPLFAPLWSGSAPNTVPAYTVQVQFRTNRPAEILGDQVIDWELDSAAQSVVAGSKVDTVSWHIGDPIRIALRFAKNAPLRPVADSQSSGESVDNRIVSFAYPDAWSLFRLVQLHKAPLISSGPHNPTVLSFYIPTVPDVGVVQKGDRTIGGQVRVYVHLTVNAPGTKGGLYFPDFPVQAPLQTAAPIASALNY